MAFRDDCYKVVTEEKTFQEAEEHCRQFGENVHLVSIDDIIEEDFTIVFSHPENIWIGLSKTDVKKEPKKDRIIVVNSNLCSGCLELDL